MISLIPFEDYLNRAERDYVLEGKNQFQFSIRGKTGELDFYQRLDQELQAQQNLKVLSYRAVKEGFTKISRPAVIGFEDDILLKYRPHVRLLRKHFEDLAKKFSVIHVFEFARSNYSECSQDPHGLAASLEVFNYLLEHKEEVVGLTPRQIPHGQSTKLIGKNNLLLRVFSFWYNTESVSWRDFFSYFELQDKPAEFRFFGPSCRCQSNLLRHFHGLLALEWMDQFSFSMLKGTLIVENFEAFYHLTGQVQETLLIWGGGWKAVQLSRLFQHLPKPIFYWGDIDKEGYEIYGLLQKRYPSLKAVLMSQETVMKNINLHQKKEIFSGPFRLVEGLQKEYEGVCLRGIQIEQEQLTESWPFISELS